MASRLSVVKSIDGFDLEPLEFGQEVGSSFGWGDRIFQGFRDGKVFDYSDWEARDLQEMLKKDYNARRIENVLSLPLQRATTVIAPGKKDSGESSWLNEFWERDPLGGGCQTPLQYIINQMTSAFAYKKAYFEKVWDIDPLDATKVVYSKIAWRPQTTCRLMRDPRNGEMVGFEQEPYYVGPDITANVYPLEVKARNAFVYLHGQSRDPMAGSSDMEIAYWAWKTKQKVLFLWFQFLEGVSLPRTVVKAQEQGEANQIASQIAKLRSSGVIPIAAQAGPQTVDVSVLDVSGKGADQFQAAVKWLDGCATNSVLAGFLDLTSNATSGTGPVGVHLSRDASDFFLQSEEAKATEMAYFIRKYLFAPLVRHNFGRDASIPTFAFQPLNSEDKSTSVEMLSNLMRSRDPALVPDEFIGELAYQVAEYLGMDGEKVRASFDKAAQEAKAQAAERAKLAAQQFNQAQQVAGVAGAVNKATQMVKKATAPAAPKGPRGPTIPGMNGAPNLPRAY